MNNVYSILWFDDNARSQKAFENRLRRQLKAEGFGLDVEYRQKIDEKGVGAICNQMRIYNKFDLIMFDHKLEGSAKGAKFAAIFRQNKIYTDMVYYSSSDVETLWTALRRERVDGVYVLNRDGMDDDLIRIVKEQVARVFDVNNMRGYALQYMSAVEGKLRSALAEKVKNSEDAEEQEKADKILEIIRKIEFDFARKKNDDANDFASIVLCERRRVLTFLQDMAGEGDLESALELPKLSGNAAYVRFNDLLFDDLQEECAGNPFKTHERDSPMFILEDDPPTWRATFNKLPENLLSHSFFKVLFCHIGLRLMEVSSYEPNSPGRLTEVPQKLFDVMEWVVNTTATSKIETLETDIIQKLFDIRASDWGNDDFEEFRLLGDLLQAIKEYQTNFCDLNTPLAYHQRHAPSLQFGIGSASHAAERRPRFPADYLATRPMRIPANLLRRRPGPDDFRFISPIPGHQFPKAAILYQIIAAVWRQCSRRICRARQFPMFSMMLCAHRPSVNYRQVCA